jgi:hypothetical protein
MELAECPVDVLVDVGPLTDLPTGSRERMR